MTSPKPLDVAALRKLLAACVPAPWERSWDGTLGRDSLRAGPPGKRLTIGIARAGYGNVPPEGALIAALVNAAPALLQAAEERDQLRTALVKFLAWNPEQSAGSDLREVLHSHRMNLLRALDGKESP